MVEKVLAEGWHVVMNSLCGPYTVLAHLAEGNACNTVAKCSFKGP